MTTHQPQAKPSSLRLLILSPTTSSQATTPLFPSFLEALTGSKPSPEITTFEGYTSHPPLKLTTKYYSSDVSIWCDELPVSSSTSHSSVTNINGQATKFKTLERGIVLDGDRPTTVTSTNEDGQASESEASPSLEQWKSQILSPEAEEVRAVIGGIVLLLPILSASASLPLSPSNPTLELIQTLHELREAIEDGAPNRDIASLVVLQPSIPGKSSTPQRNHDEHVEQLEERCLEEGCLGWDFVVWDGLIASNHQDQDVTKETGTEVHVGFEAPEDERNQFGEKTGLPRVLEVLEAIDWTVAPNHDLDDDDHGLDQDDLTAEVEDAIPDIAGRGMSSRSGLDSELQREMMELKMSMLSADDEDDDDEEAQVNHLPALLERVVAIREAGSEMGKAEREQFAKREIARIMKEMG